MRLDELGIWFPAVKVGTGVDVFTEQLCAGLNGIGIRAEVSWLPARAEYLPWSVNVPQAPSWASAVHVNTWLHRRFVPPHLPLVATMHLCVHDPAYAPYKSGAQALYHRYWVRPAEAWILERACKVVAVSEYTAERTRREFGAQNIQTIINGVPIPASDVLLRKRRLRKPFRLLYVGNWSSRKGVDMLGPIMHQLGNEFELRYTADAHGAHQRAQLPANCVCIGRLSQQQVSRAYQEADALLFPSRLEGLPLSVLEAMAAGLPAIVSDQSSLPEVVTNGIDGYVCPGDDVPAFVAAARHMSSDESALANLSAAARRTAQDRFPVTAMVSAYASLYHDVIARR